MPKLKSKRGAKKRFKVTATGKVKASKSNRRHILTTKTRKSKRHSRKANVLNKSDSARMRLAVLG